MCHLGMCTLVKLKGTKLQSYISDPLNSAKETTANILVVEDDKAVAGRPKIQSTNVFGH